MILEWLGLVMVAFLIADWFRPIQIIKDELSVYEWPIIGTVLYCVKCTAFWLILIVMQNLYLAAIGALLGYIVKFIVDQIEKTYR